MTVDVDAVCFDLDDTLCTYTQSSADVLSQAFERVGVVRLWTVDDYHARYRDYLDESAHVDDLRRRCFADLAVAAGADRETGLAVADEYSAVRDQNAVDLLPGAREVVETLGDRHRLGLVTNGAPEMQREKLAAIGLSDSFDAVVYAGYDAAAKPASEPFEVALDALGSAPDRAAHVGNSLSSDVAGARAAGLRSIWVPFGDDCPETPDPAPDHTLGSIADLATPP
ncbi:HAD family hydrolase [Halosolutus gelatinilyticus]|uniref:HAD family hydrolase n=1 Tax=Halosolutus gelatinilyticus TaxID=2931975 RepID=UPI001FF1DFDB|nr:HAD family hydrolase [Halosolutus gelatinilyticus]